MEQLKAVVYCRIDTPKELNLQYEKLRTFAERNGYHIVRTILEFGNLDDMTWRTSRIMARYREYDILLLDTLDVLNASPENITEEIRYLSQNGVSVVSIIDGMITTENLPELFRKRFRVIKWKKYKLEDMQMKAQSTEKERAVVLLRASSKQQTDREHDFDIPQQKSILLPFVDSQGWELVKVFTEGGVSGFKVSANNRDAIQDIKKMADNREFDRLVIYMSDRLGRIADETPLIVSYLNQRGIIVFSYTEGEISARDHTSKLITYIRYWQAEGESRKTSQRVSDAITQAVLQGRFRGGNIAYGYKMVNNGHNNYKGRPVLDITVDEEGEAPILRLMFKLARERNYGYRRIARYLNENNYPTRTGVLWRASPIRQILNNPCYKGYYQLNYKNGVRENPKLISPFMPELVIISEEEWNATHEELQKHTTKSKGGKKSNHGSMLLAGIMFCGTCGRIMTSFQSKGRSKVIDGVQTYRYVPKYRCNSVYFPKENLCVGQTTYGAKKVETAVIRAIKRYMETLNTQELMTKHIEQINGRIDYYNSIIEELQNTYTQISVELKTLKDEVVKSLLGTSNFDSRMLQEILSQKELELKSKSEEIENAERELATLKGIKQHAFYLNGKMQTWSEDFDTQEIEGKKSMLFQVVDRIELFKDRVEIIISIKMDMHKNSPTSEEISNVGDVKCVSLVKKQGHSSDLTLFFCCFYIGEKSKFLI